MDKNKLLQEIYRNRTLMGLSEKNLNNLITEAAIPPGWTKLFAKLATAADDDAAKKIINTFKREHPDDAAALDKFLKEGGFTFEGRLINSLDSLTGFGKFKAYQELTPFIKSNGDAIVSILAKYKVNNTLPKKITTKFNEFSMDELTKRLIDSNIDEGVKDYLRAFKDGDVGKYSIDEMEGFISLIRRNANNVTNPEVKDMLIKYCNELDEVVQGIKNSQKQIGTNTTSSKISDNTALTKQGETTYKTGDNLNFKRDKNVGDETGAGERTTDGETGAGERTVDGETGAGERTGAGNQGATGTRAQGGEETRYTTNEQDIYDSWFAKTDAEINRTVDEIKIDRAENKFLELTEQERIILDVARNKNLITEDVYLETLTPFKKSTWMDFFNFARELKEIQKGQIVSTKIDARGKEVKITKGQKISDRLVEARRELEGVTDPVVRRKKEGEIMKLQGLQENDFEKYIVGKSQEQGKRVSSDYFGQYWKSLGSKKISSFVDMVEQAAGKYPGKTYKPYLKIFGIMAGITTAGLIVKGFDFLSDVGDLIGEKLGLSEFNLKQRLVDWSKGDAVIMLGDKSTIDACPGASWCEFGLSKDEFQVVNVELGIFVTTVPLYEDNYIYKFSPKNPLNVLGDDVVIPVPKDSKSLSKPMKTQINAYMKKNLNIENYLPTSDNSAKNTTELTKKQKLAKFKEWCTEKGYDPSTCVYNKDKGKWEYGLPNGAYKNAKEEQFLNN